jgi:hypothetical protein
MADPTADEVHAALAVLAAAEAAREAHVLVAAPVEPVMPSESAPVAPAAVDPAPQVVSAPAPAVAAAIAGSPAAPVDPYVARSVKSSPNGF